MAKYNPALASIALAMFEDLNNSLTKEGFVPMGATAAPQGQPQPGQPGQGDPSQAQQQGQPPTAPPQADPSAGAAGPSPTIAPPGPGAGQGGAPTLDDIRSTVRQEVEAANEKPKKQSVDERLTALEGAFLRLLQHLGLIERQETDLDAGLPQDASKMQDQGQGQGGPGELPPTGQTSDIDLSALSQGGPGAGAPMPGPDLSTIGGGASPGMPKSANLNNSNPYSGLAAAAARLRSKV